MNLCNGLILCFIFFYPFFFFTHILSCYIWCISFLSVFTYLEEVHYCFCGDRAFKKSSYLEIFQPNHKGPLTWCQRNSPSIFIDQGETVASHVKSHYYENSTFYLFSLCPYAQHCNSCPIDAASTVKEFEVDFIWLKWYIFHLNKIWASSNSFCKNQSVAPLKYVPKR